MGRQEFENKQRILVIDHSHDGQFTDACKTLAGHGGKVVTMSAVELIAAFPKSQPLCKSYVFGSGTAERFPQVARHMAHSKGWKGSDTVYPVAKEWRLAADAHAKYAEMYGPESFTYHWQLAMVLETVYRVGSAFYHGDKHLGDNLEDAQEVFHGDPKKRKAFISAIKKVADDRYGLAMALFNSGVEKGLILRVGASYTFLNNHLGFDAESASKILDKDKGLFSRLEGAISASPINKDTAALIAEAVAEKTAPLLEALQELRELKAKMADQSQPVVATTGKK